MNISEVLSKNPELAKTLTISVNAAELREFGELCIERGRNEKLEHKSNEEYLTPQQLADILHVSLVTLWSWDKKGITRPLRIGNAKRYRRSDLEKILSNAPPG